nr:MAG TPA: hypothetical protein [Caudoviricetes sp.]
MLSDVWSEITEIDKSAIHRYSQITCLFNKTFCHPLHFTVTEFAVIESQTIACPCCCQACLIGPTRRGCSRPAVHRRGGGFLNA